MGNKSKYDLIENVEDLLNKLVQLSLIEMCLKKHDYLLKVVAKIKVHVVQRLNMQHAQ